MTSSIRAFARVAPRTTGLVACGGAYVRPTRARGVRILLTRPLSGLYQTQHHPISVDSRACGPQQTASALAHAPGCSTQQQRDQVRRLMSSQSDHHHQEPNQDAIPVEENSPSIDVTGDDASTPEETDTAAVETDGAYATTEAEQAAAQATGPEEDGRDGEAAPVDAPEPIFQVQVDGIAFSVSQEELEEWFRYSGVTPAKVTLVMRPAESPRAGQNKGRAYVELANEEDTLKALSISGRSMGDRWVSVARLEAPLGECRTISVRGLKGISEEDFKQFLEDESGVAPVSVRVVPDNPVRNQSGLAFAEFETPEHAKKALSLDGINIMSRWIDVSLQTMKKRVREPRSGPDSGTPFGEEAKNGIVMMLKGLPFSLSDDEIKAFLLQYISEDDIVQMKVPKHNNTTSNTGIAFLHLKNEEAAQKAIALRGSYIGERWVDVSRYGDGTKSPRVSHKAAIESARTTVPAALRKKYPDLPCVVVSGLPFHKSKTEVTEYLAEQGVPEAAVEEMQMPLFLSTQNNTGACWLVINEEEAYNRIMSLNGAIMEDRWVTIADA